ncbi:hypothetical protein Indivirus_6_11 [Indivirus ILV1]|uniref:F-box domain-containing protein n=1 Tax=Indivirus ILV1 TaxID=1977633 RepID=A0A1V0SE05_9VIRU|nr:hypothetical protein Indivirus_6_11 [Indivirus ILV1]
MSTYPYDIFRLITLKFNDFESLFNASMTCKTWRRVYKDLLPELLHDYKFNNICFKITKLRFLMKKDETIYGYKDLCDPIYVEIYDRWNKKSVFPLYETNNKDENFAIYESNVVIPATRFKYLEWKIRCTSKYSHIAKNMQIVPDDLNCSWFMSGNDYIQSGEQFVIGSLGALSQFKCCCAVTILPSYSK